MLVDLQRPDAPIVGTLGAFQRMYLLISLLDMIYIPFVEDPDLGIGVHSTVLLFSLSSFDALFHAFAASNLVRHSGPCMPQGHTA